MMIERCAFTYTSFFIYMKKVFCLICFLQLFFSCSKEEEQLPYLNLSDTSLSFAWEGGKQIIVLESNVDWSMITELPEWLDMNVNSDETIEFEVSPNNTNDNRDCKLVFCADGQDFLLLIVQGVKEKLAIKGLKEYTLSSEGANINVELEQNVAYYIDFIDDAETWIHQLNNGSLGGFSNSTLSFLIDENQDKFKRVGKIAFFNEEFLLSDTLMVIQEGGLVSWYLDGEYKQIQKSSKGDANLVILGDGFLFNDLREGGAYEKIVDEAISYFFSIEPYKTYREYFNVYMVVAESEEEGVGEKTFFGESTVNNKFGTAYGSGTEIVCNDERIFEYARKVKELPEDKPITVLVVLNSDKYAGTAYLYKDGNSIALCPMSTEGPPNDFEGIVHHEAGGHAFGFLCDEYVYNQSEMPEERKKSIKEWQKQGFHLNLDFTNDFEKILWKDFIGMDKYAPVGAYEGGYEYQFGVWRSEENSCMNNNIPYYNVQSRWCIVKRIMELSDIEFTVQDFISNDNPVYPTDGRTLNNWDNFVPLGHPIWVKK